MIDQIVAQSVGVVVEPAGVEKIEGRIRIGESLFAGGDHHGVFPESHARCWPTHDSSLWLHAAKL